MWEEAFSLALQSGIFAVLFCCLLFYELKVSGKREARYQKTIQSLSDALMTLRLLRNDIDDLERLISGLDLEVKGLKEKWRRKYDLGNREMEENQ